MNKEYLEAMKCLEVINNYGCGLNDNMKFSEVFEKEYNTIEQALQRLESIDNANPSEALKCLREIEYQTTDFDKVDRFLHYFPMLEQSLIKAQEQEIDRLENQCLDVLADNIRLKNKAQEQEKENTRAFGKDIINLDKTLKETIDKPILYVCRYGNKYIVPQKLFDEQCNVLALIKEFQIDLWLLNQCDYENYIRIRKKAMVSVGQIVNEDGVTLEDEITEEYFDLVKRYFDGKNNYR